MGYTAEYTRLYPDGYVNLPDESTPEMAEQMNIRDDTIIKIEQFLAGLNIELAREYALLSEAGYAIDVSINDEYVLRFVLNNKAGVELSSNSIDLPIESMIIDIDYADGNLILTLQNEKTISVSIVEIVRGLVPNTRKIAGIDLEDDITSEELVEAERKVPGAIYVDLEESEETEEVIFPYMPYPTDASGNKLVGEAGQIYVANGDGTYSWMTLGIAEEGAY